MNRHGTYRLLASLRRTTKRKLGARYATAVGLLLAALASGFVWAATAPVAQATCSGHLFAQASEQSGFYYGSKGNTFVENATGEGDVQSWWVNSTFVIVDANNYVEVGWTWHGGSPKATHFISTMDMGSCFHQHYGEVETGSFHGYRTNHLPQSGGTWVFYADDSWLAQRSLNFTNATAGAMQERQNRCNYPDGILWDGLQRADSGANFSSWTNLGLRRDDDPDYCINKLSDIAFETLRVGDPNCDLST